MVKLILLPFFSSCPFLSFLLFHQPFPLQVPSLSISLFKRKKISLFKFRNWSLGILKFSRSLFWMSISFPLCHKHHFPPSFKKVIYFAITVESQVSKSKITGQIPGTLHPDNPRVNILHNSSAISQQGNWHCCNPGNMFGFHQCYLHSLVYLWT